MELMDQKDGARRRIGEGNELTKVGDGKSWKKRKDERYLTGGRGGVVMQQAVKGTGLMTKHGSTCRLTHTSN